MVGSKDIAQLNDIARESGSRHAHLTSISFQPEWWLLFKRSLLDCMQPFCRSSPEVLDAWEKLMDKVIREMEVGFEEAKNAESLIDLDQT